MGSSGDKEKDLERAEREAERADDISIILTLSSGVVVIGLSGAKLFIQDEEHTRQTLEDTASFLDAVAAAVAMLAQWYKIRKRDEVRALRRELAQELQQRAHENEVERMRAAIEAQAHEQGRSLSRQSCTLQ